MHATCGEPCGPEELTKKKCRICTDCVADAKIDEAFDNANVEKDSVKSFLSGKNAHVAAGTLQQSVIAYKLVMLMGGNQDAQPMLPTNSSCQ